MTEDWNSLYWTDIPIVVFDLETTGFSANDRICEVALVVSRGAEIIESFYTRVNPECHIEEGATAVHGLCDHDVESAPTFGQIKSDLTSFFRRDLPWVSHNLAFDARMLSYVWDPSEWPRGTPTLCTLSFAKKRHPVTRMRGRHKLADLANCFGVEYDCGQLHEATYDTKILASVVPRMMEGRAVGDTMTRYSHEWRT